MQLAVDAAGFSAAEADQLRQAMGSKRSQARMARMRDRLMAGMAERGITGDTAEEIYTKLEAFSSFGFPESHSVSFAYLVYSSSWIKYHYPAEFAAALLNAQPMGFYSPHTIVRDAAPARRAGARSRASTRSRRDCTLEPRTGDVGPVGRPLPGLARRAVDPRGAARAAVGARALHDALLDRIDDERARRAVPRPRGLRAPDRARPSTSSRRSRPRARSTCFGVDRRAGLWAAGALARRATPTHAARRRHRHRGAAAAGHDRGGGDRGRPVGDGHRRRASTPPSSCARS